MRKRTRGDIEFGIIYGGIALLVLVAVRFFSPGPAMSCVFHGLTGIPCPTCGATRSVTFLAHGEIIAAIAMNPLVAMCFIGAVMIFCYDFLTLTLRLPVLRIITSSREQDSARLAVLLMLAGQWIYLILTSR